MEMKQHSAASGQNKKVPWEKGKWIPTYQNLWDTATVV